MLRLALALLILTTTSSAFAEEQQQVAVLNLIRFTQTRVRKDLHEKERFDASFARKMEDAGWSVVQATDESCGEGVDCLAAIARRLGVARVVRITGQGNVQLGYQLNLEAFRPKLAQTVNGTLYCDICNPAQLAELAADDAQKKLATVAKDSASAAPLPAPPVLAAPEPLPEPDRGIVTPPPSEAHAGYRWVSWTLLALAVPVTAYGAWALYKNGETSNPATAPISGERHHETYSSKTLGIACLASGIGAALLAGVIYILEPTKTTSVAFSPTSVDFSVRF